MMRSVSQSHLPLLDSLVSFLGFEVTLLEGAISAGLEFGLKGCFVLKSIINVNLFLYYYEFNLKRSHEIAITES